MFDNDIKYIQTSLGMEAIVQLLYDNNNISECCARLNLNPAAVAYVIDNNAEFRNAVYKAQAWQSEMEVDKLSNINEDIDNPLTARVISDNIKWKASKRAKDRYGDKLDIAVTHTIDLKSAIAEARQRSLPFIDGKALELHDTVTAITTVDALNLDDLDVFA